LGVFDLKNPLTYNEEFDVVYSHLSLHFFDESRTEALFQEIFKASKPNGIFATILNSTIDPEIQTFQKIGEYFYLDPDGQSKRYFSTESILKYAKNCKILLLDDKGETWKDKIKGVHGLIRFVGQKI